MREKDAFKLDGYRIQDTTVERVVQTRTVPPVPISSRLAQPIQKPSPEELIGLEMPNNTYTMPWHNDHQFILVHLQEYKQRYPNTREKCITCGRAISIRDCAPNNYVFVHYENYWVPPNPVRGAEGFYTTSRLRPVLIHCSLFCLKER